MAPTLWDAADEVYGPIIRNYHLARGADPEASAVLSTIRTNTGLVPKRGDHLLRLLHDAGIGLEGKRVLDLGCGFGALSCYLGWRSNASEYIAVDVSDEMVAAGETAAGALGLGDRVRFVSTDMRDLSAVGTGFDVVIANNSLYYLPTREALRTTLRAVGAATSADGGLVIYQANRWRWREPFTKDPLVHLLPPRVASPVSRLTGWRHNHGRVRFPSPMELRRRVRAAGYRDVQIISPGATGARRYFTPFFALVARRVTSNDGN